jgi:hypothetical protein
LQTKYETIKIKTAVFQNVIAVHYTKGQLARVLALSVNVRLSVSDDVRHCQNTVLALLDDAAATPMLATDSTSTAYFSAQLVNNFFNVCVDIFVDLRHCQTLHIFVCQPGT